AQRRRDGLQRNVRRVPWRAGAGHGTGASARPHLLRAEPSRRYRLSHGRRARGEGSPLVVRRHAPAAGCRSGAGRRDHRLCQISSARGRKLLMVDARGADGPYAAELNTAFEAAAEAATILTARAGADQVREKGRADLVTAVDE